MEIHRAPGPPRTSIVLGAGRRIAVLEVAPGWESGAIVHPDRSRWHVERVPGASEWWCVDDSGRALGTVTRTTLVRERFVLDAASDRFRVRPDGSPWRRHWSVLDTVGRQVLEVRQRSLTRTVHDLSVRSGDLPRELPLLAAWVLALATTDPLVRTRRSHSAPV